jgi:hypothetical protein
VHPVLSAYCIKEFNFYTYGISISFSWSPFNPCFRVHSLLMRVLIWIQAKISMQIRVPAAPKQECDTLTAQKFNTGIVEIVYYKTYFFVKVFLSAFRMRLRDTGGKRNADPDSKNCFQHFTLHVKCMIGLSATI